MYLRSFNPGESGREFHDLIVVGSGLAGLSTAYYASQTKEARDKGIAILTRHVKTEASSFFAQGGIAAAVGEKDSPELHFRDTMNAGHGINNEKAVRLLVKNTPGQIEELKELGLEFDEHIGLEGMHSTERIMHINGDRIGFELTSFLLKLCRENGVQIIESEVLELIVEGNEMQGILVSENESEKIFTGNAFALASGGYSGLWLNSTNPFARGSIISKASSAGAMLMNLEFQQFHPTTFGQKIKGKKVNFLISEAVRGEGALLVNQKMERIAEKLKNKELSGRDVISRMIFEEMNAGKKVFLDCSNKEEDFWRKRFPTIYEHLKKQGLKMGRDLIQVEPAAHYSIGGIKASEEALTSVKKMYAVGECSCNGLHGANRLASNSLSECLVFGKITGMKAIKEKKVKPVLKESKIKKTEKELDLNGIRTGLREKMWENVGIQRNAGGLKKTLEEINLSRKKLMNPGNEEEAGVMEELTLAGRMTESALNREKSIGVHYRTDFQNKPKSLNHSST